MTDPFDLSINYKGSERNFVTQLILWGYSHKFKVLVNETEIYFEPDEEGQYRAVKTPGQDEKEIDSPDLNLLHLIGQKLAEILA